MKFLDLFAGVGGIRLGMEQAGHSCVGWVEWDKFARKSYIAIHNPDGEFTEKDINDVKAELLPKADCWCFGFPCQDISVAGKQGGFTNGKRSSLFFKVTGLIRELKEEDKPSYLFIENVKNLLSINKGWDFAKLLIEMDEIGYDVEWDVLDSAEVVPQHRERIFIVGHLRERRTRKVFPIVRQDGQATSAHEIKVIGNTSKTGYSSHDIYDQSGIVTTLMARDYKDPKQVAVHQVGNVSDNGTDKLRIRKITPLESWRLQGFPDWAFDKAQAVNSNSQLYKQAGNSVTVPVICEIAKRLDVLK